MKKNKSKKTTIIQDSLALILLLVMGTLIFLIIKLDVLAFKFLVPILLLLLLLGMLPSYWVKKSKSFFSSFVVILLIVVMLFSVTQVSHFSSLMGKVTGANTQIHTINVIVMKDSKFGSMSDFENRNVIIGANLEADEKNIKEALNKIEEKEKMRIEPESFDNYQKLVNSLYSGEIDAMIINDAFNSVIDEYKEKFYEETRIIGTYSFVEKLESDHKKVDVLKDTFSIYVTGIDTYGPISSVSRSDVNMIVTVNPNTNQILLTSIPRDYYVTLNKFGKKDKLTHAGNYGVNESIRTVEDLLSNEVEERIEIDYFLRVNFSSVTKIVDALGGIKVESKFHFKAEEYEFFHGENYLDGKKALAFTRARKTVPGGDDGRIINQQALITGILNKVMSPAIITNFSGFLSSVSDSFEFSMPSNDLNKMIKKQQNTMSSWEVIDIQLKGTGAKSATTYSMPGWNLYVSEPNYKTVKVAAEIIQKMEKNLEVSKKRDWPFE